MEKGNALNYVSTNRDVDKLGIVSPSMFLSRLGLITAYKRYVRSRWESSSYMLTNLHLHMEISVPYVHHFFLTRLCQRVSVLT